MPRVLRDALWQVERKDGVEVSASRFPGNAKTSCLGSCTQCCAAISGSTTSPYLRLLKAENKKDKARVSTRLPMIEMWSLKKKFKPIRIRTKTASCHK